MPDSNSSNPSLPTAVSIHVFGVCSVLKPSTASNSRLGIQVTRSVSMPSISLKNGSGANRLIEKS